MTIAVIKAGRSETQESPNPREQVFTRSSYSMLRWCHQDSSDDIQDHWPDARTTHYTHFERGLNQRTVLGGVAALKIPWWRLVLVLRHLTSNLPFPACSLFGKGTTGIEMEDGPTDLGGGPLRQNHTRYAMHDFEVWIRVSKIPVDFSEIK